MKIAVILGSTRQGRQTERVASWVANTAKEQPDVEVDLIDLRDFPMPFFDEPQSPRYNPHRQVNEVAQKWLQRLQDADAYIFVTPEYNHSIPGVLKNALDYLTWEMVHKPASIVSHGSVGGARAAVQLKEILSESRAAIIPAQVAIAGSSERINEQGELNDEQKAQPYGPQTALNTMLEDLIWYGNALSAARTK